MKKPLSIAVICTFLWIGFVGAISFMEAWLKFQAPGITLPLGLGIGRLVFNALNKVEIVFAIVLTISLFCSGRRNYWLRKLYYLISLALLLLQSLWLLPALDARAELIIAGQDVPASNLHFYYVGTELVKVAALFALGIKLLNNKK